MCWANIHPSKLTGSSSLAGTFAADSIYRVWSIRGGLFGWQGRGTYETPVPFFFFSTNASNPPSKTALPSRLSIDSAGLPGCCAFLFPLLDDAADADDLWGPNLNICTVSCAELTARSDDTTLKLIEYIRASLVPLRNWYNFSAPGTLQTRMTVPFSEEVASRDPVEFMDRKEMGALCAWMTLATVRERVEKRRTSPD